MRLRALLPLLALIAISAPATAENVDYAKSEFTFVSKQMNVPVQGRFKKFTAQIVFDAKAEIAVDLASIDTGSDEADEEVGKKAWFNTGTFPAAKFSSNAVKQTGPDRYEVRGKLTIKGIGQDVIAPFSVKRVGDAVTYEGAFTLKRLQFKIGEGVWSDTETVADEVQVKFRIVATGNK
jgi:polyisoprenoid-binding protein YceI